MNKLTERWEEWGVTSQLKPFTWGQYIQTNSRANFQNLTKKLIYDEVPSLTAL